MEEEITSQAAKPQPAGAAPPDYEPPRVVTHRGAEILEKLGPAQACSFNHSVLVCG